MSSKGRPGASGRVLPPVTGRSWVRVAVSSHCTGEGKACHSHPSPDPAQSGSSLHWVRPFIVMMSWLASAFNSLCCIAKSVILIWKSFPRQWWIALWIRCRSLQVPDFQGEPTWGPTLEWDMWALLSFMNKSFNNILNIAYAFFFLVGIVLEWNCPYSFYLAEHSRRNVLNLFLLMVICLVCEDVRCRQLQVPACKGEPTWSPTFKWIYGHFLRCFFCAL